MKRIKLIFLLLLFLIIGCKKSGLTEPLPEKANKSLKYFGFTLIDVGWDEPGDRSSKTNYSDEVHSFSNIADILVSSTDQNIIEKVDAINGLSMKPILHLNDLFFELKEKTETKSGSVYGLRKDYKERWNEFIAKNDLTNNYFKIHSFYIGEEPAWNGIQESDFKLACDYAKLTIPQVPIMLVEAYLAIDDFYAPSSVDYVGFDHYFLPAATKSAEYASEFQTMKSRLLNHQKIFLVLDAHWIKKIHGSCGIARSDMDFIARNYYEFANQDTCIAGILGYFWPSGFDAKGSVGARNLPKHVKAEYERIGKSITGK